MKTISTWKRLEEGIWTHLQDTQSKQQAFVHRFYDSASAGNLLPIQPADFLLIREGVSCFIEAKFSERHQTLVSCFSGSVKQHQLTSAYLTNRAGCRYRILFYSLSAGRAEVWDGLMCYERRQESKRLRREEALAVFDTVQEAMDWIVDETTPLACFRRKK